MIKSGFDPYQWKDFYFPSLNRDEAIQLLSHPSVKAGTFLLRNSSRGGGYSLTVREEGNEAVVRHYLITNEVLEDGRSVIKLSDQTFPDLPSLLNHYKMRVLDSTSLFYPLKKRSIDTVVGTQKFIASNDNELSFEVGERLEIIEKPSDEWWEARNALGSIGQVPRQYLITATDSNLLRDRSSTSSGDERFSLASTTLDGFSSEKILTFPLEAIVLYDRNPNAYDTTQLRLKKGQRVNVVKKVGNGMYEGTVNGKTGKVPQSHIEFFPDESI